MTAALTILGPMGFEAWKASNAVHDSIAETAHTRTADANAMSIDILKQQVSDYRLQLDAQRATCLDQIGRKDTLISANNSIQDRTNERLLVCLSPIEALDTP